MDAPAQDANKLLPKLKFDPLVHALFDKVQYNIIVLPKFIQLVIKAFFFLLSVTNKIEFNKNGGANFK